MARLERALVSASLGITLLLGSVSTAVQAGDPSPSASSGLHGDLGALDELQVLATAGDAGAQYELGSLYRLGQVVKMDDRLAFRWMQAAANQGHVKAEYILGRMLYTGRGTTADRHASVAWLRKASDAGSPDATAMLGVIAPSAAPGKTAHGPAHAQARKVSVYTPALLAEAAGPSVWAPFVVVGEGGAGR